MKTSNLYRNLSTLCLATVPLLLALSFLSCVSHVTEPVPALVVPGTPTPEEPAKQAVTGVLYHADWSNPLYTIATLDALAKYGPNLLKAQPSDRAKYCSAGSSPEQCWVAVISSMSRYESSFDTNQTYKEKFPDAQGNPVISAGLLQVSKESCNGYGAKIASTEELKVPANNLRCAVLILNKWVSQDGVIASNGPYRGGARYWSVLREKYAQIQARSLALTK